MISLFDFYRVDAAGEIYSMISQKVMKLTLKRNGYLAVFLSRPKRKWEYIHRLVALDWVPNPNKLSQVNHKNGIKTDNRAENLEWVTHRENGQHASKIGLLKSPKGEKNGLSKLNSNQILKIRSLKESQRSIAKKFSISQANVSLIKNKKAWRHI